MLEGPLAIRRAREIARSGLPVMLQHNGRPLTSEESLFTDVDQDWLLQQAGMTIITSRTMWVPEPSPSAAQILKGAVPETRHFIGRAAREYPKKPWVPVFAVSYRWLSSRKPRRELISALKMIEGPVGLMFGKEHDPLDNERAVEGLVDVVTALPEVLVLRCDHGVLGAYAFGASGGAIGIGTSTRHYVPRDGSGWADLSDKTPRVFLPAILAWWKGSRLGYYAEDPLFDDSCTVCKGSSLARFEDEALTPEADAHSVASWASIADELAKLEPSRRADRWIEICTQAYDNLDMLEDLHKGLPHPPSKQLKAWLRFAGIPAV